MDNASLHAWMGLIHPHMGMSVDWHSTMCLLCIENTVPTIRQVRYQATESAERVWGLAQSDALRLGLGAQSRPAGRDWAGTGALSQFPAEGRDSGTEAPARIGDWGGTGD